MSLTMQATKPHKITCSQVAQRMIELKNDLRRIIVIDSSR